MIKTEDYIVRIFRRLLLIVTLLNLIIISSIVTVNEARIRLAQGQELMTKLQSVSDKSAINWSDFQTADGFDKQSDYIKLTLDDGKVLKSSGMGAYFQHSDLKAGIYDFSSLGLFQRLSKTKDGITYDIWLSMNAVLVALGETLIAILGTMGATLILGLLIIRRYAKRLSEPLSNLTESAKEVDNSSDELTILPVPGFPLETHELTLSFNQLLVRLQEKIEQEKQFASDASHELRTPLTAIRANVTLLKRRAEEHPEILPAALDYLDAETERMTQLIEELLTLSRAEKFQPQQENIKLDNFVEQLVSELQPVISQKIRIDYSSDDIFIKFDRRALRLVVTALLENAAKYSPDDSTICLKFDARQLSVADEGAGIPDSEKTKIFERFYRIDQSRNSDIPGTGLGLAIAKNYALLNQAEISVEDNVPCGSVFVLRFDETD